MAESSKILKRFELKEFPQPEIVRLQYPIFLCHGFGGMAAVIKSSPLQDPCLKIRSHGVVAIAPNIVPYAKIETRAENWVNLIKQFCKDHNYDKVNVVAHSMGGLDMRFAISKFGIAEQVESLTTIATPHYGSSLAELALEAPEILAEKLIPIFDWFGNSIYSKTKSNVLGSLEQLTRTYMNETFNPSVPDVDSVQYYSYSAAVGMGTDIPVKPFLKYQNTQIYDREGINDAFVSVISAKWGKHIETVPLSHLLQLHMQANKEGQKLYDEFWLGLLKMLSAHSH